MSKVAIKGAVGGTATFTIESPATNTDRVLVLPNVSGTLVTTGDIPSPTIASTAEAEAGTNNTNFITPLRMREGFNASGSAPVYACRAWVNFNGTGTVAIRASGNVSSITDNGTGDYTVNFTTAMPDANYCVQISSDGDEANPASTGAGVRNVPDAIVTASIRVTTYYTAGNNDFRNTINVSVAIFR